MGCKVTQSFLAGFIGLGFGLFFTWVLNFITPIDTFGSAMIAVAFASFFASFFGNLFAAGKSRSNEGAGCSKD
jgi:hypothetical protein